MTTLRTTIILLACSLTLAAQGAVRLPSLLSDGMVLQRDVPNKIWGTADAGESITVRWQKKTYTTTADDNGAWSVLLPATKAGGPYALLVGDQQVSNILVGDVWLCSGQSNMELPVSRVTDMFADEIAAYENDKIRQVIVPREVNFHAPQDDIAAAAWHPATKEYVMSFSALAYFFARALYEKTGIPVGIINAAWGGTPIEAWMSEEALAAYPQYVNAKKIYDDDAYCEQIKDVERKSYARWSGVLYATDEGRQATPVWYDATLDDSNWQTIGMFDKEWGSNGRSAGGGSHWLRQTVTLSKEWDGTAATLRLGCIVDADSVYVNGRFVGSTGYQYPPRIYAIPAGLLHEGDNNITVRIISNGAHPSFVPEKPYKLVRQTADGSSDEVPLSTTWKYHLGTAMPNAPGSTFFCYKPICLYNAMIAPLRHCALSGVLWYQGESNVGRRNEYAALLTTMMADWRQTFNNDTLPFYIIELADFLAKDDTWGRQAWAAMRVEQGRAAAQTDNAYLIKNDDLGEWNDIHPLDKKTLAGRIIEKMYEEK